jgi:RNA polymerase sigma-70 factor (ECF subfamily)
VTRTLDTTDLPGARSPVSVDHDVRLDFDTVYTAHAAFIWRSVRALGVPVAHVDDAVQDVFVIVHRKLETFRGPAKIQTWLFEIARRVASQYRRSAVRDGRSDSIDAATGIAGPGGTFEAAARNEAATLVVSVLEELDDAKRELIVLADLEQVPIPDIAALLEIPLNTAYSRIRLARKAFAAVFARRGVTR